MLHRMLDAAELVSAVVWALTFRQAPEAFEQRNGAGAVGLSVEAGASEIPGPKTGGSLNLRLTFDLQRDYYPTSSDYGALRDLYAHLETRDAEPLVLVRP